MPQLPTLIGDFSIQGVFEGSVAFPELCMELRFIGHTVEIEGSAGAEDHDLFREVAVVGIVETVWPLY